MLRKKFKANFKTILAALTKPKGVTFLFAFFALLFTLSVPSGQTPDESNHFLRAYELSDGQFTTTHYRPDLSYIPTGFSTCPSLDENCRGNVLPKSISSAYEKMEQGTVFNPTKKFDYSLWEEGFFVKIDAGEKAFYSSRQTSTYSPVGYIPQIIAISVLKPFNPPIGLMIYLAKLLTIAFCSLFLFISAKLLQTEKKQSLGQFLILFSLLPMVLHISISLGVDAMQVFLILTAVCLTYFRVVLKPTFTSLKTKESVHNSRFLIAFSKLSQETLTVLTAALILLATLAKPTSAVFLALLFLGNGAKSKLLNAQIAVSAICSVFVLGVYEAYSKFSTHFVVDEFAPYSGVVEQKLDILKSRGVFTGSFELIGHFFLQLSASVFDGHFAKIIWSTIGRFGQNHATFPVVLHLLIIFYLFLALRSIALKEGFLNQKFAWILIILYSSASFIVVWIIATDLAWFSIGSFQGRYLLPIFAIFPFIKLKRNNFQTIHFRSDSKFEKIKKYAQVEIISPLIALISVFTILLFFQCGIFIMGA